MIQTFFKVLVGWLPFPLYIICSGVITLFFLVAALRLIAFILDLIPFL
ncbi:MAG: hypothetical protein J6A62_08560 [Oscillospiraceae bacterium]|nr:hypothetical protein [Oscillospiraceae bacterium]